METGRVRVILSGDPNVEPKQRKRVLRDPDWTELSDQNFRDNPDWYIETGTLLIGETFYTFYDLNF